MNIFGEMKLINGWQRVIEEMIPLYGKLLNVYLNGIYATAVSEDAKIMIMLGSFFKSNRRHTLRATAS